MQDDDLTFHRVQADEPEVEIEEEDLEFREGYTPVKRKRKPPSIDTWYGWSRRVSGILLNELKLGLWQITGQSEYKKWFAEGMRPTTAANAIIDAFDMGIVKRRPRRKKKRQR